MPSVDPKTAPRSTLPPALQDLLVREAVFMMSRKRISEALTATEKERSSGSFARPLLSLFARKDRREKDREEGDNAAVLKAGIEKLDAAYPQLEACVERSLENYLREHDAEYANGLAASRFIDDWHRLLAQFEVHVSQVIAALNALPAQLDGVAEDAACSTHPDARRAIDRAVGLARAAQDDVAFVNKIADAQRIRAGVDNITLYRQPERNWRGAVHALHFVQPALAQDSIQVLIGDIQEVAEKVRSAIQGECQLASYVVGYGVTSYHRRVWASLREAAPLQVNPETMEAVVAETENLMDSGRLEVWRPHRPDPVAPANVPAAVPAPPPAALAGAGSSAARPTAAPRPATSPVAAVPAPVPAPPPPALRLNRGPSLKLPSRQSTSPAPEAPKPVLASAPSGSTIPPDSMEDLMAERNRLEQILLETRASLTEREQFLSQSEARLMQVSQAQIEREVDLEQREEQLRDLEKRLRDMQASLSKTAPIPPAPPAPARVVDEFNE